MITLDRITLPGILFGIVSSFLFSSLGYPVLAGSGLKSIAGALIGFSLLFLLAEGSIRVFKKEGVGGGTIKLATMIGSFVGLMIIPVMVVAFCFIAFQAILLTFLNLQQELKWVHGTLSPGFFSKYHLKQVATSNAFVFASWAVISWPGFRYLLHIF